MTFKIEKTLAKEYKIRLLKGQLKFVLPIFIGVAVIQFLKWGRADIETFSIMTIFLVVLTLIQFLVLSVSTDNLIRKFAVNLTDTGIDRILDTEEKQHISWNNLKYVIKKNGSIEISEIEGQIKSMSMSKPKMIVIPPEIERKSELLDELQRHCA